LLPGLSAGQSTGKTWASGVIIKLGPTSIGVKGTVSLMLRSANGQPTKFNMDGTRRLNCEVKPGTVGLRGFHVGNWVSITCLDSMLTRISHSQAPVS
jgi:hypothetical protein